MPLYELAVRAAAHGRGEYIRLTSLPAHGPCESFEPVVKVHLGAFAEVSAETASATQSSQFAGAGSGNHAPVATDDVRVGGRPVIVDCDDCVRAYVPLV